MNATRTRHQQLSQCEILNTSAVVISDTHLAATGILRVLQADETSDGTV